MLNMPGAIFWCILLFLTLYSLGLDSCFAIVEAISTILYDGLFLKKPGLRRDIIALFVTVIGIICSLPFCLNSGDVLADIVDHYLSNYIMLFLGIFQS